MAFKKLPQGLPTARKVIVFFAALFAALMFLSFSTLFTSPLVQNFGDKINIGALSLAVGTITFIVFLFAQSFFRNMSAKKILKEYDMLLTLKTNKFKFSEKSWHYLMLIIIYFSSVFNERSFKSVTLTSVVLFVASLLFVEILLRSSEKSIKVSFFRQGILVHGTDIRITLPIIYGLPMYNESGYYSFDGIDEYFDFHEYIELYLSGDMGSITVYVDGDSRRQLLGLLAMNKIKMKKFK